jgi:hypothetical protein
MTEDMRETKVAAWKGTCDLCNKTIVSLTWRRTRMLLMQHQAACRKKHRKVATHA